MCIINGHQFSVFSFVFIRLACHWPVIQVKLKIPSLLPAGAWIGLDGRCGMRKVRKRYLVFLLKERKSNSKKKFDSPQQYLYQYFKNTI